MEFQNRQNFHLKNEVFLYIRPSHRRSVVSKVKPFVNGNLYTTAFKIRNKGEIPIFKDIFENKSMTKSQIIWSFSKSITSCYVTDLSRYYIVPVICIFLWIECMLEKISFKFSPEIETLEYYQCHHLQYVNSFKKLKFKSCKSTGWLFSESYFSSSFYREIWQIFLHSSSGHVEFPCKFFDKMLNKKEFLKIINL